MALVSTNFRETNASCEDQERDCLFCNLQKDDRKRIIAENSLAYAIRDGFPVTEGHTLFIPKRHTIDYFGLVSKEILAINELIEVLNLCAICDSIRRVFSNALWYCYGEKE